MRCGPYAPRVARRVWQLRRAGGHADSGAITGDEAAAAVGPDQPPPEFYDDEADDRDLRWVDKLRKGHKSGTGGYWVPLLQSAEMLDLPIAVQMPS